MKENFNKNQELAFDILKAINNYNKNGNSNGNEKNASALAMFMLTKSYGVDRAFGYVKREFEKNNLNLTFDEFKNITKNYEKQINDSFVEYPYLFQNVVKASNTDAFSMNNIYLQDPAFINNINAYQDDSLWMEIGEFKTVDRTSVNVEADEELGGGYHGSTYTADPSSINTVSYKYQYENTLSLTQYFSSISQNLTQTLDGIFSLDFDAKLIANFNKEMTDIMLMAFLYGDKASTSTDYLGKNMYGFYYMMQNLSGRNQMNPSGNIIKPYLGYIDSPVKLDIQTVTGTAEGTLLTAYQEIELIKTMIEYDRDNYPNDAKENKKMYIPKQMYNRIIRYFTNPIAVKSAGMGNVTNDLAFPEFTNNLVNGVRIPTILGVPLVAKNIFAELNGKTWYYTNRITSRTDSTVKPMIFYGDLKRLKPYAGKAEKIMYKLMDAEESKANGLTWTEHSKLSKENWVGIKAFKAGSFVVAYYGAKMQKPILDTVEAGKSRSSELIAGASGASVYVYSADAEARDNRYVRMFYSETEASLANLTTAISKLTAVDATKTYEVTIGQKITFVNSGEDALPIYFKAFSMNGIAKDSDTLTYTVAVAT